MTLDEFLDRLDTQPESIEFEQTMQIIEDSYHFQPTAFTNGSTVNEKGTNEGSCKIFAFAELNNLDTKQTLHCFGKYYREDVLLHPDNDDHGNIRQFMKTGIDTIKFENPALI
ncbi:MAG: HopJ type III effector protein [Gammaproteobacteria bacterium]|nr:HopJ type III effector protein [Gammaproteobacteria bacterium]NNJ90453.1 HopJ type III effector protein [Gammaproteobacteria bacterium]